MWHRDHVVPVQNRRKGQQLKLEETQLKKEQHDLDAKRL